jgi:mannose-6-phosphate isomerase
LNQTLIGIGEGMTESQTLFRLEAPVRNYAWGSHDSLARIRGAAFPTLEPEAELWIGAHAAAPALVPNEGPLNRLIADEPGRFLGVLAKEKYGPHLPFLLKVLAVARPLSLQVHPTLEEARAGFVKENELGVSISSSDRTFVDDNHKPELVVAVSDFDALVGFRDIEEVTSFVELLIAHGAAQLEPRILHPLQSAPNSRGLRAVVKGLVGQPDESSFVDQTAQAAAQIAASDGKFAASARWLVEIARLFPARPDVVATLLLNLVHLRPGDALYVAPGQVHCYLGGLAMEIMASSDNVVRGGLTPKRVDVPSFLAMVDWTPGALSRIAGVNDGAITTWTPPIDDFILSRISLAVFKGVPQALFVEAPMVLFAISNGATITRGSEKVELVQGESLFVAPGSAISVSGDATLWCGSCGVG